MRHLSQVSPREKEVPMASRALTTIALSAVTLLAGCSTFRSYDNELQETNRQLRAGNLDAALILLPASSTKPWARRTWPRPGIRCAFPCRGTLPRAPALRRMQTKKATQWVAFFVSEKPRLRLCGWWPENPQHRGTGRRKCGSSAAAGPGCATGAGPWTPARCSRP